MRLTASKFASWAIGLALVIGAGLPLACGEEEGSTEPVTVRTSKDRLHFALPPDWPVEKRGGILAPIPIEEYLAKKFKTIETHLQGLEQRLGSLDLRLRVLEEELKKQRQALSASPAHTP